MGAFGAIKFSLKVFVVIFLVVVIAIAIHSWLLSKSYVFNHKVIASMTNKAIAAAKSGRFVVSTAQYYISSTIYVCTKD